MCHSIGRRAFVKRASQLVASSAVASQPHTTFAARSAGPLAQTRSDYPEQLGWKPHWMKQGAGKGGWVCRRAEIQFLHAGDGKMPYSDKKFPAFMPFGVVEMDNGQIVLVGVRREEGADGKIVEKTAITFSKDLGSTWEPIRVIDGAVGRPMMLTKLGSGKLVFQIDYPAPAIQYFSHDYGRTWTDRQPLQPATSGTWQKVKGHFPVEGNALVEVDAAGKATRIAQIGYNLDEGAKYPQDPTNGILRWSTDGGRSWTNETRPREWRWKDTYQGKTYDRGVSEGSLVRAKNGWLVAALRTDMPARFIEFHNDNMEGTGISISKDDGKSWSPVKTLFVAGRMHAHLLRMPDGSLVMTYIMRHDIENQRLASYRRGCGAVVSRDNGLSWDVSRQFLLDDFEFADATRYALACGHLYSALLSDGSILTCYGNYPSKGAGLIRWKPAV